jgi:hypothetical protein
MPTSRKITVRYSSVDHFCKTGRFTTLEGARTFAHLWVGSTPEFGHCYAVSSDGVGKIEVLGATLHELFPEELSDSV